jgi:hypothetical protein
MLRSIRFSRVAAHRAVNSPLLFLGALLVAGACREPLEPGAVPAAVAAADQYLAQLVVAPGATTDQWLVRVTLTGGVSTTRVAGFRARLVIPASLTVEGDVADQGEAQGSMLRVVRSDGGDVLATGASAEGMAMGDLFVASVRGPVVSLAQLRLELAELVDVRGTDQRKQAVIANRVNDSRIRK